MNLPRKYLALLLLPLALISLVVGILPRPASGQGGHGTAAEPHKGVQPALTPTLSLTPSPTPVPWDDILIDDGCDESCHTSIQSLVVAGSNLYAVYYSPGFIYFTRSKDGGASFSPPVTLDAWGIDPALARREGAAPDEPDLYVAFYDQHQALFTGSTDAGSTWSPPAVVYDGTDAGTWPVMPKLAVDAQGVIYITWYTMIDSSGGPFFLARSTDAGLSWSSPITMTEMYSLMQRTEACSLAVHDGALYFAWMGSLADSGLPTRVMFTRSTDRGQSWSPAVRVDDAPQDGPIIQMMAMAVDPDGIVYVQWNDDRVLAHYALTYLSRSTDDGATWSPGVRVDDAGEHFRSSASGSLAVEAGGQVYIVLEDGRHYWDYPYYFGWDDLFLAHSTDGGQSWAPNEQISNPIPLNLVFHPSTQLLDGVVYTMFLGNGVTEPKTYIWLDRHNDRPPMPPWTPTASPTPVVTPSPSPGQTRTVSPTASATPWSTATATSTATSTPTATGSPTLTGTPTPTDSPSPSATGIPTTPPTPRVWKVGLPWVVVENQGVERR